MTSILLFFLIFSGSYATKSCKNLDSVEIYKSVGKELESGLYFSDQAVLSKVPENSLLRIETFCAEFMKLDCTKLLRPVNSMGPGLSVELRSVLKKDPMKNLEKIRDRMGREAFLKKEQDLLSIARNLETIKVKKFSHPGKLPGEAHAVRPTMDKPIYAHMSEDLIFVLKGNRTLTRHDKFKKFDNLANRQLASFRLDRYLGFDLIPSTAKIEVNGEVLSAQLYIPGGNDPGAIVRLLKQGDPDISKMVRKESALNYLIGKADGNGANVVWKNDLSYYSIDQANTFHNSFGKLASDGGLKSYFEDYGDYQIADRILAMTKEKYKALLGDLLSQKDLQHSWERFEEAQKLIPRYLNTYETKATAGRLRGNKKRLAEVCKRLLKGRCSELLSRSKPNLNDDIKKLITDDTQIDLWKLSDSELEKAEMKIAQAIEDNPSFHGLYGLDQGATLAFRGDISDNLKVVIKSQYDRVEAVKKDAPEGLDKIDSEVAAYEIDRLLGLKRVPLTGKMEIAGEPVSYQLFVDGLGMDPPAKKEIETGRAALFDYLISNTDRETILNRPVHRKSGKMILIDNGDAFNEKNFGKLGALRKDAFEFIENYPEDEIVLAIEYLDRGDLEARVGHLLDDATLSKVLQRLEIIKDKVQGVPDALDF